MEKYILYCKKNCPYSNKAISVMTDINVSSKIYNVIGNSEEKKLILNKLKPYIGSHDTFPIIFYKNNNNLTFIGGYNELITFLKQK